MHIPSEGELILRILLAMVLGGVIGLEREITDHPAGVRTHIAIAVGSALFGILSAYGFEGFNFANRNATTYQVDPTRIASNIVTGVGFLGGGAILKQGATVRGLTTAASMWVTAAIGLGVALGSYGVTLVAAGAVVFSLAVLRGPARWVEQRLGRSRETLVVRVEDESVATRVVDEINNLAGITLHSLTIRSRTDEVVVLADIGARMGRTLETTIAPLSEVDGVLDVDIT